MGTFRLPCLPRFEKVLEEYEIFEKILKRFVDNVFYFPSGDETGLDSIYTHDPVQVTENGEVLMNMGKALRRDEPKAAEKYLGILGIPILGAITEPGRMEGGDVLLLDEEGVALGRGYRTSDEGIRQFLSLTSASLRNHMFSTCLTTGGRRSACISCRCESGRHGSGTVGYSPLMPVRLR